ncbi:peptidase domain-containing ABC transporter [Carboxylicivirga sp. N1Y90]|uniref:peptidase domain-containing ABC transporter n=1 Tax=Carboxylicivirga fragile TaxID=3417571 RepID=UPI003D33E163|nr:ATP-binding cassette domain-containing protein [Marinilabiliaceae bacterium N1Y90]
MLTPTKRFWSLLSQYNSLLKQIYIYAIFIGVINLTLPVGIQAIINFLQAGEMTSTWLVLVGFVLLGISLAGVLQVLQLRLVENIQQDLFARSAFEFAFRLPEITLFKLDKVHAPELANRFFDTLTLQKGLPKIIIDFSLAIFQIVFGLILLAIYSSYFIVLGMILGLILWIIFKVTGPLGLKTSMKESKYKYRLAHWLEEIARVHYSFKLFGKDGFHLNKTDNTVQDYLKSRESHFQVLLTQFWFFVGFKIVLAAGLLILGGYLVFSERINLGQFVAAEIIIILILNSIEKILQLVETVYDVLTGLEKIGHITDLDLDANNGTLKLKSDAGIHIMAKNIYASFPDDLSGIINGLSLDIKAGEKILIEGSSGSGKSLLMRLLSGVQEVNSGKLLINDIAIENYTRSSYYQAVGIVFPTNQIFEGTIRENIEMGSKVDEAVIQDLIDVLGLNSFLNRRPKGLDTVIDSGGRRLTRSIIKKLLLARALVKKPSLLLLENPLQYLEDDEKKRIINYLCKFHADSTILVISNCEHWKNKCNRIINISQNQE